MISDRGMLALRCGAAFVGVVPSLRLQVLAGERVLAQVMRPPLTDDRGSPVPAGAFHRAVASAHRQQGLGDQRQLFTAPEGVDPAVYLSVPPGDLVLAGGIVRVTLGGAWVHLVPVARPLDACLAVLGGLGLNGLGCRYDADMDVTILHVPSPVGDHSRAADALDRLQRAAAACAVADLEDYLRAGVHEPVDQA